MPYTMYLDQSAHLDWDWVDTFEGYYSQGYDGGASVRDVLTQALAYLKQFNAPGRAPYYYSICEMGFLYRFVTEDSTGGRAQQITAAGDNFQVIGGGITSPDTLVCSGEGLVRNYLVGRLRLAEALPGLRARPYCVIPDDFGQDPELPVLLQALGFPAVVFGRLPGTFGPDLPQPMGQLKDHGVDFAWRASDGSEAVAHWMLSPDGKGNYAYANPNPGEFQGIANLVATYQDNAPAGSYPAAATPYMYFSVENDFSMPLEGLLDAIEEWNESSAGQSGVVVRAGTFADFADKVVPLRSQLQSFTPYDGTPYWTGYYASRPALKTLHYATVRTLLEAEAFGLLIPNDVPGDFWAGVATTWVDFAPSTHHDFVCGTACDDVYGNEQLPLLTKASQDAAALRDAALAALASTASPAGQTPVLVGNGLGFARTGLVEIPGLAPPSSGPGIQPAADGGTLIRAEVPSFGFATLDLGAPGEAPAAVSIAPATSGADSYTLANEFMQVTISAAAGWGIEKLVDVTSGQDQDVLAGASNQLVFYKDAGDIYRFGNEFTNPTRTFTDVTGATPSGSATVLEAGPLRARLGTTVTAATSDGSASGTFSREYALVAGEPFLRMTTTGAAFEAAWDGGYSVMTRFRLAAPVATIDHGTGGHWTAVQPLPDFWPAPVFRATHDFLLPRSEQGTRSRPSTTAGCRRGRSRRMAR